MLSDGSDRNYGQVVKSKIIEYLGNSVLVAWQAGSMAVILILISLDIL